MTKELEQLCKFWHQKAETLAKEHFDEENNEGWGSDEAYGNYSTLVDCAAEIKQIIEKYKEQK